MERIQNLKEKIYLLTYGKPRYKSEISKLLYGKDVKQIYPEIKKLESPGTKWIKKVNYKGDIEGDIEDGRSINRIYYHANVEPLFDSMCRDLKNMQEKLSVVDKNKHNLFKWEDIELTVDEEKKLQYFLGHNVFRKFVYDLSEKEGQIYGFNDHSFNFSMIKNQFSHYCVFLLCCEFIKSAGIEENLKRTLKRYESKKNFKDFSEGVLSFGFILIEKLTYLDYRTSSTLMPYLLAMWRAFPEISCSMPDENPLSKFIPEEDFFTFLFE